MNSALVATLKNIQLSLCSIVNKVHIENTQLVCTTIHSCKIKVKSYCHTCVRQCNPYNIAVHTCHTWTSFHGQTWCNKGHKQGRKCYVTPAFSGVPKQRATKSEVKVCAKGHHDAPRIKAWIQRLSRFPQWHRKVGAQKRAEMLRHPCILGGPQIKGDKIRSQNLR